MKTIYVFGRIKNQSTYVIDRIRRRVSLALYDSFNFESLDDQYLSRNIDLFHGKTWKSCYNFYLLNKLLNRKMKYVSTFYGTPLDKKLAKKIVKHADIITTVSQTTKQEAFKEFGETDYRVVYDGVDSSFYKPTNEEMKPKRVLMNVTTGRKLKNIPTFLDMAKRFPSTIFYIHTFDQIKSKLPNICIDNIKYPVSTSYGDCKGLKELYNKAYLYLFPSIHEGLNNTILEAMACGLPIIAFDTTSMNELIEHGKNGFLCKNHRDMHYYIDLLLQDESLQKTMGKRSREIAKWYSWKRCIQGYKDVYGELL